MDSRSEIKILESEEKVIIEMCAVIEKTAKEAIARDDIFKIGLSGGSLTSFLARGLPHIKTDWSKWKLFFCDERVVPLESSDSTYGTYKSRLLGEVPVSEDQFVKVDPYLTAEDAAKDYIQKMAVHFPPDCLPRFHLLLLGVGPDGHTCSLFPGHRILEETSVWVAPISNSPKPPASRITLTFPVVNNAECCIFAVTGSAKADIVKRILVEEEPLPAARVRPTDGKLYWFLDRNAAAHLREQGDGHS